jgi:uncharacterized CHY-type Zn-finger protein
MLLALRVEMLAYLRLEEHEARFCNRCRLPLPEGEYDSYDFCPWCSNSINGGIARIDESRRIIENEREERTEIQCGECGCEYEQPTRYPFRFCVVCGAPFAAEDEMVIVLPWMV